LNFFRRFPRQSIERKAKANRRISGRKKQMAGAQHPNTGLPLRPILTVSPPQRENVSNRFTEPALKYPAHTFAIFLALEFVVERIEIHRQIAFFQDVNQRIFIGGDEIVRIECEVPRQLVAKRCASSIPKP
jgi:hypothetical protein